MEKPERYYRFTNDVNLSGTLVSERELNAHIENLVNEEDEKAGYTSVYSYPEDAIDYYNSHYTVAGTKGSLSGYTGESLTNHLIFDMDSSDLDKALFESKALIRKLVELGFSQDSVSAFFSGGKGFHIKVRINEELNSTQLKVICSHIAKEEFKTFDPKIYNRTRLIRIPNTKHEKTGFYKVEFPLDAFLDESTNMDAIKDWAKNPQDLLEHNPSLLPDYLLKLAPVQEPSQPNAVDVLAADITQLNFSRKPTDMPYCKYAVLNGFFNEGTRHSCLLSMAAFYKDQGYPVEITTANLNAIIAIQEKRYPTGDPFTREQLWNTVVSSVYAPSWKGGVPNCRTDDTLKEICQATGMHDQCSGMSKQNLGLQTLEQLDTNYNQHVQSLETNIIKTGINFLDSRTRLMKGGTHYIAGRSGCGKTTVLLHILKNTNKNNINSLFFSADTSPIIIYQRMVATVTGFSQEKVEAAYRFNDPASKRTREEWREKVNEVYGRTHFNVKTSLTFENIRNSITEIENKTGNRLDFIVIDYNERVINQFTDPLNSVRHTALNLVDMARDMNKCFLIVAQVSRNKGSERTPLTSKNAAKESGAVEESANVMITMWRPLYGSENENDDKFIGMCIPKNRMGIDGVRGLLHFEGSTSTVRDATASEKSTCEYKEKQLAEREKENKE